MPKKPQAKKILSKRKSAGPEVVALADLSAQVVDGLTQDMLDAVGEVVRSRTASPDLILLALQYAYEAGRIRGHNDLSKYALVFEDVVPACGDRLRRLVDRARGRQPPAVDNV